MGVGRGLTDLVAAEEEFAKAEASALQLQRGLGRADGRRDRVQRHARRSRRRRRGRGDRRHRGGVPRPTHQHAPALGADETDPIQEAIRYEAQAVIILGLIMAVVVADLHRPGRRPTEPSRVERRADPAGHRDHGSRGRGGGRRPRALPSGCPPPPFAAITAVRALAPRTDRRRARRGGRPRRGRGCHRADPGRPRGARRHRRGRVGPARPPPRRFSRRRRRRSATRAAWTPPLPPVVTAGIQTGAAADGHAGGGGHRAGQLRCRRRGGGGSGGPHREPDRPGGDARAVRRAVGPLRERQLRGEPFEETLAGPDLRPMVASAAAITGVGHGDRRRHGVGPRLRAGRRTSRARSRCRSARVGPGRRPRDCRSAPSRCGKADRQIGDTVEVVSISTGEAYEMEIVGTTIVNDNFEASPGRGAAVAPAFIAEAAPEASPRPDRRARRGRTCRSPTSRRPSPPCTRARSSNPGRKQP